MGFLLYKLLGRESLCIADGDGISMVVILEHEKLCSMRISYPLQPLHSYKLHGYKVNAWGPIVTWFMLRRQNDLKWLCLCVCKDSMTLPEYVLEHDKELEEHPLMDYGIVSTRDAPWQASMG